MFLQKRKLKRGKMIKIPLMSFILIFVTVLQGETNSETPGENFYWQHSHTKKIKHLEFSPDGKYIVTGEALKENSEWHRQIKLRNAKTCELIKEPPG